VAILLVRPATARESVSCAGGVQRDDAERSPNQGSERASPHVSNRQVAKRASPILVPQPGNSANGTSKSYYRYGPKMPLPRAPLRATIM
jgi:hypothetical protein